MVICIPAESRALPFTLHNTYPQGYQVIHRGVGVIHSLWKTDAGVLRTTAALHILPHKKYTVDGKWAIFSALYIVGSKTNAY
jgi:hypothetical protein